jgi:hypothetical protein
MIVKKFLSKIPDFNNTVAKSRWITDLLTELESVVDNTNFLLTGVYGDLYTYTQGSGLPIGITAVNVFTPIETSSVLSKKTQGFVYDTRQLRCSIAGTYLATWSMSVESTIKDIEVEGAVGINHVAQVNTTSHNFITAVSIPTVIAGSGILTLVVNDTVGLMVANHTNAGDLSLDHLTLTVTRIGA